MECCQERIVGGGGLACCAKTLLDVVIDVTSLQKTTTAKLLSAFMFKIALPIIGLEVG